MGRHVALAPRGHLRVGAGAHRVSTEVHSGATFPGVPRGYSLMSKPTRIRVTATDPEWVASRQFSAACAVNGLRAYLLSSVILTSVPFIPIGAVLFACHKSRQRSTSKVRLDDLHRIHPPKGGSLWNENGVGF